MFSAHPALLPEGAGTPRPARPRRGLFSAFAYSASRAAISLGVSAPGNQTLVRYARSPTGGRIHATTIPDRPERARRGGMWNRNGDDDTATGRRSPAAGPGDRAGLRGERAG